MVQKKEMHIETNTGQYPSGMASGTWLKLEQKHTTR